MAKTPYQNLKTVVQLEKKICATRRIKKTLISLMYKQLQKSNEKEQAYNVKKTKNIESSQKGTTIIIKLKKSSSSDISTLAEQWVLALTSPQKH